MMLKEILMEYKEATINFINNINNDYKSAENYIEVRKLSLEKLKSIEVDKEEFKKIYEELEILEIDKKAMDLLKFEKQKVNDEIVNLKRKKDASQVYNNAFKNINFINKRI